MSTYVNVDVLEKFSPDIVCNISRLDLADDNSYDLIRASHVLERFELLECRATVAEWHRVCGGR